MSKKQTPEEMKIAAEETRKRLLALFGPPPAATATATATASAALPATATATAVLPATATATAVPVPAAMATAARPAQPKRMGMHTLADLSNGTLGSGMGAATASGPVRAPTASGTMTVVVPPPAAAAPPQPALQPSGFNFRELGECLGGMNRQVENLAGTVDQHHRELARQGRAIAALQAAQQRGGRGRGRGRGRGGSFRPMGAQSCFGDERCTDVRNHRPLGTHCGFNHAHLTDDSAPATPPAPSPPPSASSVESND